MAVKDYDHLFKLLIIGDSGRLMHTLLMFAEKSMIPNHIDFPVVPFRRFARYVWNLGRVRLFLWTVDEFHIVWYTKVTFQVITKRGTGTNDHLGSPNIFFSPGLAHIVVINNVLSVSRTGCLGAKLIPSVCLKREWFHDYFHSGSR